jgi:hypothetical protein
MLLRRCAILAALSVLTLTACRTSQKTKPRTFWDERIEQHLKRYSNIQEAHTALSFLRRKNTSLLISNAKIESLTPGSYDKHKRAIQLRGAFPINPDSKHIPERTAVAAALIVHEVSHAREIDSGMRVICWETEILATLDQALFERQRSGHTEGKRLEAIDAEYSPQHCAPWWNCPLAPDKARDLARVHLWQSNIKSDRIAEWLRIRVLAGGYKPFLQYHDGLKSLNPGDGFLPSIKESPSRVIPVLEALLQQWRRHCTDSKKQPEECKLEQTRWSEQLKIWTSPRKLHASRKRVAAALARAQAKAASN